MFMWKERWWKAAQCKGYPGSPRLRGSGQGYKTVPELQLGSSQQQGLCISPGRNGGAVEVVGGGGRSENLEVPSNLNCSTILNGVDVLMVLSQYREKIKKKNWICKICLGYKIYFCRPNHFTEVPFPLKFPHSTPQCLQEFYRSSLVLNFCIFTAFILAANT